MLCGSDHSPGPLRERRHGGTHESDPVTAVSGPGILSAPIPVLPMASDNEQAACAGGASIYLADGNESANYLPAVEKINPSKFVVFGL